MLKSFMYFLLGPDLNDEQFLGHCILDMETLSAISFTDKVVSATTTTTTKAEKKPPTPAQESSTAKQTKIASVSVPKVSITEVLASKHLNDASKFHVFTGLVQDGQMSNKEVVNSILYLVRSFDPFFIFIIARYLVYSFISVSRKYRDTR